MDFAAFRRTSATRFAFTRSSINRSSNSSVELLPSQDRPILLRVRLAHLTVSRASPLSSADRTALASKAEQLSSRKRKLEEEEEEAASTEPFQRPCEDQFSRVKLVLGLKQLLSGNYPCPIYNPFKNFKQLRSSYKPVTSISQILALDVETVRVGTLFRNDDRRVRLRSSRT